MKGYTVIEAGSVPAQKRPKPIVSVIVPIYNAERFLDQALTSIEQQTLTSIEILCVNDGSTDGSREIIQAHEKLDDRIGLIDKPNGGYGSACNRGFDEAQGEWIAIVEPDDWIEPPMYKTMVDFAASFPEPIDMVKTPYTIVWLPDSPDQRRFPCDYHRLIHPTRQPFTLDDPGVLRLLGDHPSIWSAIYRREFLQENAIRFPEYPGSGWADNPFFIETLAKAQRIAYLPKAFYNYRENTPEQDEAFILSQPFLPLERWQTMTAILKENAIIDPGVHQAHNERGFLYLRDIVDVLGWDYPGIQDAAAAMFQAMDDSLVFGDSRISPAWKQRYGALKQVPIPPIPVIPYVGEALKKGVSKLINAGPKRTFEIIGDKLSRRKNRAGKAN